MAQPSTLFRFHIDLSDIERNVYEALDFRVAMHPSETPIYLVTRVLAFALNYEQDLKFSPTGLSDPDSPALSVSDPRGGVGLWIEIGNPSTRKLHKAAKISKTVRVYTYKDPKLLLDEMMADQVFKADKIEVFSFSSKFLDDLAECLERDNKWSITFSDGTLTVSQGDRSYFGEIHSHRVETR